MVLVLFKVSDETATCWNVAWGALERMSEMPLNSAPGDVIVNP